MSLKRSLAVRAGWIRHAAIAITQQHHTGLAEVFRPFVPAEALILDVGAHAGQFSKLFAQLAPQGVVHAFEPSAYARSILRPALRLNRVRNVKVHTLGLSNEPGELTLHTPIKRRGGMGFGTAHLGDNNGRQTAVQRVTLTTIDRFAQATRLCRLDFIKADIEGWEGNMLRGAAATLHRFRPAIYMEIDAAMLSRAGDAPSAIWDLLTPLGYRAQFAPTFEPVSGYVDSGDYLFSIQAGS